MRKKGIALILAAVCLLAASSCKSTLGPAIERDEGRKNVKELSCADMYDEENGYHYPNLPWGLTLDEVQSRTYDAVTKVNGVDTEGNIVFTAQYLRALAGGRQNDDAQVGTDPEERLIMVMLVFSQPDRGSDTLPQNGVFEFLEGKLTELYGEPDEKEKRTDDMGSDVKADLEELCWRKTLPDGTITRMTLSKAFVTYEPEPDYVSLSFTAEEKK